MTRDDPLVQALEGVSPVLFFLDASFILSIYLDDPR